MRVAGEVEGGSREMLEGGSGGNDESHGGKRELARGLADFAAALALFWLAVFAVSGSDIRAHAVTLPTLASEAILPEAATPSRNGAFAVESPRFVHRTAKAEAGREQALLLLSLAFAAILACNLAFWRHLRRVYASPRRSVWRRG